ncbi:hypothetical protein TEA_011987 [Camellia sinensis var. sinensis]|uniref:Uncharacterized protein n=1 Tax=Camellia sinensis var. sinensis TaxID=542762 RepID=A0A4S4D277_CAMSN|nr:hypothetical protein TEA_011987 [Camellia sinensis var. sinensis]
MEDRSPLDRWHRSIGSTIRRLPTVHCALVQTLGDVSGGLQWVDGYDKHWRFYHKSTEVDVVHCLRYHILVKATISEIVLKGRLTNRQRLVEATFNRWGSIEEVGLEGSSAGQWWLDMVGKTLDEGSTFERVGSRQLAGLLIAVWVRNNIRGHVGDVDVAAVPCGFGRAIGNKV